MKPGARRRPRIDVGHPHQPMRGDEHVGDDDVVGAGGAHAVGVPDVLDLDVAGGQQRKGGVDAVVRSAQRTDDDPVAVHHPGGPRPPARQPDALARRHAPARRRQGSGREERPRRERLLLRALVEQRQHPVVQRVEADRPSAGRASVRHPADGVKDGRKVGLYAAVAGGHEQFGETRGVEVVDRGGQPAQPLGVRARSASRPRTPG